MRIPHEDLLLIAEAMGSFISDCEIRKSVYVKAGKSEKAQIEDEKMIKLKEYINTFMRCRSGLTCIRTQS